MGRYTRTIGFRMPAERVILEHYYAIDAATKRKILEEAMEDSPVAIPFVNRLSVDIYAETSKSEALKVTEEQYEWLETYASRDDRSVGGVMRLLLLRYLHKLIKKRFTM